MPSMKLKLKKMLYFSVNLPRSRWIKVHMSKFHQCYFEDVAGGLQFSGSVSPPPGGVNGGLTGLKEWLAELHYWGGETTRITAGGGEGKKGWNNPVVRAPRESVQGKEEGVGYPACRQNGTGEGAAAFLLAVQEPERQRSILRERRRSGAPIHCLLSWPRGGNLPCTHSEVLQLQRNPPGFWPWPLTDVVWRKSQRDGPQGERRVQ